MIPQTPRLVKRDLINILGFLRQKTLSNGERYIFSIKGINSKGGKLLYTAAANELTLKIHHVVGVTAEYAGGLIFLKHNLVTVGEDFNRGTLSIEVHALS